MKITLDKKVITMDEVAEAKEYAKDRSWMADKDIIESGAIVCLEKYYGLGQLIFDNKVIGTPELTVNKNHYALTIWCECLITYWREGKTHFAKLSFDLVRAYEDRNAECFIVVFDEADSRCI